jgi:hypothetical protein
VLNFSASLLKRSNFAQILYVLVIRFGNGVVLFDLFYILYLGPIFDYDRHPSMQNGVSSGNRRTSSVKRESVRFTSSMKVVKYSGSVKYKVSVIKCEGKT